MNAIPPLMLDFVRASAGEVREARWLGHEHGQGDVWWVGCSSCEVVLKVARTRRAYVQERDAYVAFQSTCAEWLPKLIATDDRLGAMLLSAVVGRPAEEAMRSPGVREALMVEAGRFRRALDEAPLSKPDPMPLAIAIPKRIGAWRRRAAWVVSEEVVAALERLEDEAAEAFKGARRVWCHRDFCPRNWLAVEQEGGSIGLVVLDLGQARQDAGEADEVKLWDEVWGGWPEGEAAWERGYGEPRSPDALRRRRVLVGLHVVATTVWGVEHGDAALEVRGRAGLRRALASGWL